MILIRTYGRMVGCRHSVVHSVGVHIGEREVVRELSSQRQAELPVECVLFRILNFGHECRVLLDRERSPVISLVESLHFGYFDGRRIDAELDPCGISLVEARRSIDIDPNLVVSDSGGNVRGTVSIFALDPVVVLEMSIVQGILNLRGVGPDDAGNYALNIWRGHVWIRDIRHRDGYRVGLVGDCEPDMEDSGIRTVYGVPRRGPVILPITVDPPFVVLRMDQGQRGRVLVHLHGLWDGDCVEVVIPGDLWSEPAAVVHHRPVEGSDHNDALGDGPSRGVRSCHPCWVRGVCPPVVVAQREGHVVGVDVGLGDQSVCDGIL